MALLRALFLEPLWAWTGLVYMGEFRSNRNGHFKYWNHLESPCLVCTLCCADTLRRQSGDQGALAVRCAAVESVSSTWPGSCP